MQKFEGKIQDNYDKYLKEVIHIGFMEKFPVKQYLAGMTISTKCRQFNVTFKVHLAKVSFGKNNEFECTAIVTDIVDISPKLFLHGFNSFCCYDEAATMEKAVVEMAKKHNLMICDKINSWPFAKAIVQPNFYKN